MVERTADFQPLYPVHLQSPPGCSGLFFSGPAPDSGSGIHLQDARSLSFDAPMNALFERELVQVLHQRRHSLRVETSGRIKISLMHADGRGGTRLRGALETDDDRRIYDLAFILPEPGEAEGRWFFTAEGAAGGGILHAACWGVGAPRPDTSHTAIVICTWRREKQLAANLLKMAEGIRDDASRTFEVLIVDQDGGFRIPPGLPFSARSIRQPNLGGSGGFGRGIFEALESGGSTHVLLMDDDADIDANSVERCLNLFHLAGQRDDIFIGGTQLDLFDRTVAADAGAFRPPGGLRAARPRLPVTDLRSAGTMDALCRPYTANFNGWWLFGGSVAAFKRFGMPMPYFLHIDDIEFGMRVTSRGGIIVGAPGLFVWHEPSYTKLPGTFVYYDIRNELITASIYDAPLNRRRLRRRLQGRVRRFLMTFQYGAAAMVVRGIEDFLKGPDLIAHGDTVALHDEIDALFAAYSSNVKDAAHEEITATHPAARSHILRRLFARLTLNGNRCSSTLPSSLVLFATVRDVDRLALADAGGWTYQRGEGAPLRAILRDRTLFRDVQARLARALTAFDEGMARAQAQWKDAHQHLTSRAFWVTYFERHSPDRRTHG